MKNLKFVSAIIAFSFFFMNFTFADSAGGTNLSGTYTIQQKSNNRFMDAYEDSGKDYNVVSRPRQGNDTQVWIFTKVGPDTYTIQQKSTKRFLDAHGGSKDYSLVTRPSQNNSTQEWIVKQVANNIYTIQQKNNKRFMDAYRSAENDYSLVTRPKKNKAAQQWIINPRSQKLSSIKKAVLASQFGPETKEVKLLGHEFNFWKTIKVVNTLDGKIVTGRFSHAMSFAKNDKYIFTATFNKKGELVDFEREIKEGTKIVTPIIKFVANELAGKIPVVGSQIHVTDSHLEYLYSTAEKKSGKISWEKAADEIAVMLALAALGQ